MSLRPFAKDSRTLHEGILNAEIAETTVSEAALALLAAG
ncbi:hypothetical protein Bra1253DRAFT_02521 [Bradyrhizobium sp. WSM1253]|nr:hypothetical protein Bra1253DRAFT_02521 [Bradyrhizobium sp. WSM1253]